MIGELLCPDCGGVVGATETTEAGPPCQCFLPKSGDEKSETVADAPVPFEAQAPAAKTCRICGKDVAHEKRAKDHLGYYCIPCAKAEELKEHQGRVRCRVCGHLHKEETLTDYEGTKMCRNCHKERTDALKQQIKRIGIKSARTRAEIERINNLLIMMGVLLVIIVGSAIYVMHKH